MIHSPGKPISLHFDSDRRILPGIFESGSYESIWWLPSDDAQDYLVLTNASTKPLQGRLTLTAPGEKSVDQQIAMGPRQIRKLSIRELWGRKVNPKLGGVSIAFDSGADRMRVSHFVVDPVLGTAANLKIFEHLPKPNTAVKTLRAPMITMRTPDPVLGLAAGTTLSPIVVLRNTSANSLTLVPKFAWKVGIESDTTELPAFKMGAGETHTIDLGAMQQDGTLPKQAQWGGYSVTYTGSDNDIIGLAATRDESGAVIAQTPFTQKISFLYKGSAWYADDLRKSLITAGNGGKEATTASLVLFYDKGRGRYELKQRLQPGEQMWLDVAYAAQNRVPDSKGNVLPVDVRSGSYELRDLDHPNTGFLFEGKLTIDKTFGHATYGCMVDCCYYDPFIDTTPSYAPVNTGNQDHAWSTCMTDGWNYDLTPYTVDWTTNNSAVSNFNGPYQGYVSIVGVGSSTVRGYVDIQSPNNYGTYCGYDVRNGPGPVNGQPTVSFATSRTFIYIGLNQSTINSNLQWALGNPGGGTYSWSTTASASALSFEAGNSGSQQHLKSTSYSGGTNDTPFTVTYSLNGQAASISRNLTRRLFRFLSQTVKVNLGPPSGTHGYDFTVKYNVLANPGAVVVGSEASGIEALEEIALVSTNVDFEANTGAGTLDANGQLVDRLALFDIDPLPSNTQIVEEQDLSVGGIYVRSNRLTFTATDVSITNNGPSQ